MKKTYLILVFTWFIVHNVAAQDQDVCVALVQDGLYQKINYTQQTTFKEDFRAYLLSEQFKSDVKSGKWGAGLTIPIDGVPITINASANEDRWKEFRNRIESITTLSIQKEDYRVIANSLPNKELYDSFNQCIQDVNDPMKTGLIQGQKIETENTVIFPFYFRPASPEQRLPKVQTLTIEPKNAIIDKGGLQKGKRFPSYYMSVVARRSTTDEITFSLQTDYGRVGGNSGPTSSSKFETPIGTIITSYLTFVQFRDAMQETGSWKTTSKWAPCDGREVSGSQFAKFAASSRVPDLRGQFLRGLNTFDPTPPATLLPLANTNKDPDTRIVGSFQPDGIRDHRHQLTYQKGRLESSNGGGHSHEVTDGEVATVATTNRCLDCINETRPKNVAIYYYIKIN